MYRNVIRRVHDCGKLRFGSELELCVRDRSTGAIPILGSVGIDAGTGLGEDRGSMSDDLGRACGLKVPENGFGSRGGRCSSRCGGDDLLLGLDGSVLVGVEINKAGLCCHKPRLGAAPLGTARERGGDIEEQWPVKGKETVALLKDDNGLGGLGNSGEKMILGPWAVKADIEHANFQTGGLEAGDSVADGLGPSAEGDNDSLGGGGARIFKDVVITAENLGGLL
ncbi:hypothetical protein BC937DRAFT_94208 [Endogone sp. FLAS-F59071]|nr:hypothetical protein BC937DRAFT_94208 [Endogone sp. FLAS-F59071]|eukprot:RUS14196.1 hypothetical protein BC937DRAFT_94208 [Endogone sp. FLAS-F59071]